MRILKKLFLIMLGFYTLFCLLLFFAQESLLFHPFPLPETHVFSQGEEVFIEVEPEVKLNGIWLRAKNPKGVILYFHGNTGNLPRCIYQAQQSMTGRGYDVFVIDYRGYGKSDGELRNQQQFYADALKVYDYIGQSYSEDRIVVLGYSLGAAAATYVAAERQPQQLILYAPFRSIVKKMYELHLYVPGFFLKYRLDNEKHIARVQAPISILHGTDDTLLPASHGKHLASLNERATFYPLSGTTHRSIVFDDRVDRILEELLP